MITASMGVGIGWYDMPQTADPIRHETTPVVFDEVPCWMQYLLWFDPQESCWVLELRDGDCGSLMFLAENRALTTAGDVAAAQAWVVAYDTDDRRDRPSIIAWCRITVCGRTGWVTIDDVDYRGNALYHDLHPPDADPQTCCSWPTPGENGGPRR